MTCIIPDKRIYKYFISIGKTWGLFYASSLTQVLCKLGRRNRTNETNTSCCGASTGSRPYSWAIWDFWYNGSMVQSICDCGAMQSAVCLSECLAAAPVFLWGATRHFVLFSCKVCAEIVVLRMFAVSLNCLNGKSSSRSIVQNIFFRFICSILGLKISYSEFTENDPKILDLKSSSEQIIFRKLSLGAPVLSHRLLSRESALYKVR